MGDVGTYFNRSEFACKCGCGFEAVDKQLLELLTTIRSHYEKQLHISSACRCLSHNRAVGSKDTSQHVRGLAADFYINRVSPLELFEWIDSNIALDKYGLGVYNDFVHLDVRRGDKKRWFKRSRDEQTNEDSPNSNN